MSTDAAWMQRAVRLAGRAAGRTSPNPLVGAVVVRAGKVVGEGYHRGPGTPHAEAVALERAGSAARGATLYVTLEPCCHTGKRTPPCAPLVARAGLDRVVVGMSDPNPRVAGGGIAVLETAGLAVDTGVHEAACAELNRPYIRAMTQGLPWVTLKVAQTLDGKVATASGASRWITGEKARRHGHRMRDRHDVILVGAGTVGADDPELTCRLPRGKSPLRVVVDTRLDTRPDARVLTDTARVPTMLAAVQGADPKRRQALETAGARVVELPENQGRVDLAALLTRLAADGHHRVLCEGGPTLSSALLAAGLVNRVAFFVAPRIMGGADALGSVGGVSPALPADAVALGPMGVRKMGEDLLIEADVVAGEPAS